MKIETKRFTVRGEEITQTILTADAGKVFTQKNKADDEERIYSTLMFLSSLDSVDNYMEITEQEAEELRKGDENG
jgi:hypothetical protein